MPQPRLPSPNPAPTLIAMTTTLPVGKYLCIAKLLPAAKPSVALIVAGARNAPESAKNYGKCALASTVTAACLVTQVDVIPASRFCWRCEKKNGRYK